MQDYWNDLPMTHLYVTYRDGRFFDIESDEEIILTSDSKYNNENGIFMRISMFNENHIKKEIRNKFTKVSTETILTKGTLLKFDMPYQIEGRTFIFTVELLDDLNTTRKGVGYAKLNRCQCRITSKYLKYSGNFNDLIKIEANSLNQLYLKTSITYRPNNRNHVCNAFKTFYFIKVDKNGNEYKYYINNLR